MKLAEALMIRADYQKQINEIQQRLIRSAKVQEGEQPPESPEELMAELETVTAELTILIQRINRTNFQTQFQDQTLSDVLAERDVLDLKRKVYYYLTEQASIRQDRYSRSEVRFISTVDIANLEQIKDNLARDYRVLDSAIQALNWQTDLLET